MQNFQFNINLETFNRMSEKSTLKKHIFSNEFFTEILQKSFDQKTLDGKLNA